MSDNVVDVRELHPRDRHPLIFGRLSELEPGEKIVLLNDHDPVPFRYQLDAMFPGQYVWEYTEEGPERWSVEITNRARTLDVRPMIASGKEPFDAIMQAAGATGEDELLVILAPFEPTRLLEVMAQKGFDHVVDQPEEGSFRVTFSRR